MIVIADTGPINYLIQIGHIEVLPRLYGRIVAPPAVCAELRSAKAPESVRRWISDPPPWLGVQAPLQAPDASLLHAHLGPGEREAIQLAQELGADELIIDELRGRREAGRRQLHFIGTLGVLRSAADQGLLDFQGGHCSVA
jgi:predicted nucleic acid-binding protein